MTSDNVLIEIKNKTNYYEENYNNFVFTTNDRLPFKIDADDRRFTVFEVNKTITLE